jgi:hypothetical protein
LVFWETDVVRRTTKLIPLYEHEVRILNHDYEPVFIWLEEHCKSDYTFVICPPHTVYTFEDSREAMLFKLRWGGLE